MTETLGQKFRQAREARKLTIKQVVQAIRIRAYYIEAMEADDYSILPSSAQAKGFQRSYAEYLGVSLEPELPTEAPAPEPVPEPEPEPEPVVVPVQEIIREYKPSDAIFQEIGTQLRQRRELLGLTLDEVERHTKVRKNNLHLIEQGDFDGLASPVQSRGMLKAYANFLDLDAESTLLRFAEGIQTRHTERKPVAQKPGRRPWVAPYWLKWFISPDLLFGSLMVLSIAGLVSWGALYFIRNTPPQTAELSGTEGPSISDVLLATPVDGVDATEAAAPTSDPREGIRPLLTDVTNPTETSLPSAPGTLLEVMLVVQERTFVRVTIDDEVKFNGRVAPGSALTFDEGNRIEVLTGNGAAIRIYYNRQDLGYMGENGRVANRIYTREGVETPTPTATPSPTNTPRNQRPPTLTPTLTLPATEEQ